MYIATFFCDDGCPPTQKTARLVFDDGREEDVLISGATMLPECGLKHCFEHGDFSDYSAQPSRPEGGAL